LFAAADEGDEHVVQCLVQEFSADVNQVSVGGIPALLIAAEKGHEHVVRCLVKEFGADVNIATRDGSTPLMTAAQQKQHEIVVWLTKHGANSQALHPLGGTAADLSKAHGAPAEQTAYLDARTNCAKPHCSGAGLKKCGLPRHLPLWQGVPGGALACAQGRVQVQRGACGRQGEVIMRATQQREDVIRSNLI
jgi:hypothetical protein